MSIYYRFACVRVDLLTIRAPSFITKKMIKCNCDENTVTIFKEMEFINTYIYTVESNYMKKKKLLSDDKI